MIQIFEFADITGQQKGSLQKKQFPHAAQGCATHSGSVIAVMPTYYCFFWKFLELKKNDYVDKITGKKINNETIKLLEIQKDIDSNKLSIPVPSFAETSTKIFSPPHSSGITSYFVNSVFTFSTFAPSLSILFTANSVLLGFKM